MNKNNSYRLRDLYTDGTKIEANANRYTFVWGKGCARCPLKKQCHQQKGDRIIKVNNNLHRLKRQAKKRLMTKRGIQKRKQRCFDTEPVFGQMGGAV